VVFGFDICLIWVSDIELYFKALPRIKDKTDTTVNPASKAKAHGHGNPLSSKIAKESGRYTDRHRDNQC
jgi:hypothetical protein